MNSLLSQEGAVFLCHDGLIPLGLGFGNTVMIADKVHDFARGSTFEAVMTLPESVAANYFATWQALSQLRVLGKLTREGLIADLEFRWIEDGGLGRKFMLTTDDTDNWPLGMAELDVLFTSPQGRRIRTKNLVINIVPGITI